MTEFLDQTGLGQVLLSVKAAENSSAPAPEFGTPVAVGQATSADNTNNAGSGTVFARANHRHELSFGTAVPASTAANGTNSTGSATQPARRDHVHAIGFDSTAPANLAAAAAAGSATVPARRDHVHKFPTAAEVGTIPVWKGTAAQEAAAASIATGSLIVIHEA